MPDSEKQDDIGAFIAAIVGTLTAQAITAYTIGEMQAQGYLPIFPLSYPLLKKRARDYAQEYIDLLTKEGATLYGDEKIYWLRNHEKDLREKVAKVIEEGYRLNKPMGTTSFEEGTIAGDLKKLLIDKENAYIAMVVQTEMANIRNKGMDKRYEQAGVEYVRRHLGPRPCPICAPHRGVIYKRGTEPFLPIHPNCMDWYEPMQLDPNGGFKPYLPRNV